MVLVAFCIFCCWIFYNNEKDDERFEGNAWGVKGCDDGDISRFSNILIKKIMERKTYFCVIVNVERSVRIKRNWGIVL